MALEGSLVKYAELQLDKPLVTDKMGSHIVIRRNLDVPNIPYLLLSIRSRLASEPKKP